MTQTVQSTNTILHGSSSSTSAFIAFFDKPWILDLGVFIQVTGIKEKFHSFFSE